MKGHYQPLSFPRRRESSQAIKTSVVIWIPTFVGMTAFLLLTGCRGPEGPAGISAEGVDITPPTIQITEPWPLDQYWDELTVAAAAVDNVAIDRVIFTLDGSPVIGSRTLVANDPPYRFEVPITTVRQGWHFVGARAYDLAGNYIDGAPRTVWLGQSDSLSDTTVTLAYHNRRQSMVLTIPDTARAEAFWIRFTPAKGGTLRSVVFNMGGTFSDSVQVIIGIWTGTSIPKDLKTTVTIHPAGILTGETRSERFGFEEDQDSLRGEFFIVVEMDKNTTLDTLKIGADSGSPPWARSGSRDDGSWQSLNEGYGTPANIIANAEFYYATVPPDTTR